MAFLDDDFVDMRCDDGGIWHLYWGDEVEIVSSDAAGHRIQALEHGGRVRREGLVKSSARFRDTPLLRLSMISSGDKSAAKEHIHPRATLMAALGQASRTTPAGIFCTELAAFFAMRGTSRDLDPGAKEEPVYFGLERTNYGIIHVRTDGERVLAFTHSGERGTNEAYRFVVSANGDIAFAPKPVSVSAPKAV